MCARKDISLATYSNAVRNGSDLTFVCPECKVGKPAPNVAFDVADVSFDHTGGVPDEALSVSDSEVADDLPDHEDTTYTVVNNGSSRGRAKLVDSNGYSYTVKRT